MNIIDRAVAVFNPKAGLERARARANLKIYNYSEHGANQDKNSMVGWKVIGKGADEDTTKNIKILRPRSRDSYMSGTVGTAALKTLRTNVIGVGLKPKPQIDFKILGISPEEAKEIKYKIESEWLLWSETTNCDASRQHDFNRLQQLAYLSKIMNGDVFVTMPFKDRGKNYPYNLTVQLIEADRITNPLTVFNEDIIEGVEIVDGEVVAYHISTKINGIHEVQRVEAFGKETGERMVLHLFTAERIGQRRGLPILSQAMEQIHQLGRYTKAEIQRAVLLGILTAVVTNQKTESDAGEILKAIGLGEDEKLKKGKPDIELGSMNIVNLEAGQDIKTVSGSNAQIGFEAFFNATVTQIGAILEIPKGVLMKSFTASYSASRAELLEFWKVTNCEHDYMAKNFCQPIYERFILEGLAKGRLKLPGYFDDPLKRKAYNSCTWVGAAKGNLDPLKEVRASLEAAEGGLSSLEIESAKMGNDFDEIHTQRVEEQKLRIEGGLISEKSKVLELQESSGEPT